LLVCITRRDHREPLPLPLLAVRPVFLRPDARRLVMGPIMPLEVRHAEQ
jgi:hypothetical protein